jgi:hypothetical protein
MSKYCNACNSNISNGTKDCPSCGADLRGREFRFWDDDCYDNNNAEKKEKAKEDTVMTHHELLDAMLNRHAVWYWDNTKPCCSAIISINDDGTACLSNGVNLHCMSDVCPTKLDLIKNLHVKLTDMLRIEEDLSKALDINEEDEEQDDDL